MKIDPGTGKTRFELERVSEKMGNDESLLAAFVFAFGQVVYSITGVIYEEGSQLEDGEAARTRS